MVFDPHSSAAVSVPECNQHDVYLPHTHTPSQQPAPGLDTHRSSSHVSVSLPRAVDRSPTHSSTALSAAVMDFRGSFSRFFQILHSLSDLKSDRGCSFNS
ncbi:hypothetical protein PFLUV_G00076490 [Perca fluviatilis]|uniref:Uncharacterized protein n=1 Tax=Perca fluviatilis TaxID=8168 RepID=A0A6A5FBN8_PERFL|nr:hypothetical protein PFLUV_G00076490 [Perca fluviatilis]